MKFFTSPELKTWIATRGLGVLDEIEISDSALDLLEQHRAQAKRHKGWSDEQREDWALWTTYTHVEHGTPMPAVEPLTKPQPATLVDQIQNERIDNIEQALSKPDSVEIPSPASKTDEFPPHTVEFLSPPDYTWVGWVALGALTAIQTFFIYGIWAHFGR